MKRSRLITLSRTLAKPIAAFVIVFSILSPFQILFSPSTAELSLEKSEAKAAWCSRASDGARYNAFNCSPGDILLSNNAFQGSNADPLTADDLETAQLQRNLNSGRTADMGCFQGANGFFNTLAVCLTSIIYVVTVGIGSAFAYVSAIFFNFAVALSLNSFSYALNFISTGWTVARDIANIFFILILVFIAFSIMLNVESVGTMRQLVWVIFIALIINFSFFFTRVAIDVSNILAVQFYNAIPAKTISETVGSATTLTGSTGSLVASGASYLTGYSGANTKDLTAVILDALQVHSLFNTTSFQQFVKSENSGFWVTFISLTFIYIAAAIFFWLLTIAFITNGIKFLVRIVMLWLMIIASPLAFIAATLPQTNSWFHKWRDTLISHSIYPVVFLFIFLILSHLMQQMAAGCAPVTFTGNSWGANIADKNCLMGDLFSGLANNSYQNSPSFIAYIGVAIANIGIRLGLVIALLYIGMKAADQIGLMGADFASKVGSVIGNKGLLRAYNVGYKHTLGRGFGLADYGLSKTKFGNRFLGYELRRYVTKPLAGTKIPGSHGESYTEMVERNKKEGPEKTAGKRDKDNRILLQEIETGREYNFGKTLTPAEIDARKAKLRTFGKRELEAAGASTLEKNAAYWSESQFKTIKDSDKFSDEQKEKIGTAWHEKSDEAPLQKAQKQINELRKINDTLSATYKMTEVSTKVGTTATPTSSTIDSTVLESMLKHPVDGINAKLAKIDSDIAALPRGTNTTALRQEKINLQQAAKALEKLNDERKNIPAKVGGEEEAGKFKNT